jgi:hypothetical protein
MKGMTKAMMTETKMGIPLKPESSLLTAFRTTLEALAELGNAEGSNLRPYADASLAIFSALDEPLQARVATEAEAVLSLWTEAKREDGTISNSKRLLWRFLSRTRLLPPAELLDRIHDDWSIEIYNQEGLQIFRSFSVFRLTSFTLEELLSIPWWERYARDTADAAFLQTYVQAYFGDGLRTISLLPVRPHVIEEIGSSEKLRIRYDGKLIAPLFANDAVGALLAAVDARIVSAETIHGEIE